jgi:hypothetical protein
MLLCGASGAALEMTCEPMGALVERARKEVKMNRRDVMKDLQV